MHQQLHTGFGHALIAKGNHFAELPAGIDMQKWEWGKRRIKRFESEMQQHRRIFADGIHHDWAFERSCHFTDNIDTFRFEI